MTQSIRDYRLVRDRITTWSDMAGWTTVGYDGGDRKVALHHFTNPDTAERLAQLLRDGEEYGEALAIIRLKV
jgi:hypothetical protein